MMALRRHGKALDEMTHDFCACRSKRRKIDRIHSNSGNNLYPTIDYDGNIGRAYSGV
jgi:hypothetical protein